MASLLRCVGANELHRRHDFWPVIVEALKVCDRSLEPCLHVRYFARIQGFVTFFSFHRHASNNSL